MILIDVMMMNEQDIDSNAYVVLVEVVVLMIVVVLIRNDEFP